MDTTSYMLGQKNRNLQDIIDQLEIEIANKKNTKVKYARKISKDSYTSPEIIYMQYGNEIIYRNDVARDFQLQRQ